MVHMDDNVAANQTIKRFSETKTGKDLYSLRYQVFGYENLVVSLDKSKVMDKSQCETRT